jgi:hypothetical protein
VGPNVKDKYCSDVFDRLRVSDNMSVHGKFMRVRAAAVCKYERKIKICVCTPNVCVLSYVYIVRSCC